MSGDGIETRRREVLVSSPVPSQLARGRRSVGVGAGATCVDIEESDLSGWARSISGLSDGLDCTSSLIIAPASVGKADT